jgi:hypothetical protein
MSAADAAAADDAEDDAVLGLGAMVGPSAGPGRDEQARRKEETRGEEDLKSGPHMLG